MKEAEIWQIREMIDSAVNEPGPGAWRRVIDDLKVHRRAEEVITELLDTYFEAKDWRALNLLVAAAGHRESPKYKKVFLEILTSKNPSFGFFEDVVEMLGEIPDAEVTRVLISLLNDQFPTDIDNFHVNRKMISALLGIYVHTEDSNTKDACINAIQQAAANSPFWDVREDAEYTLKTIEKYHKA